MRAHTRLSAVLIECIGFIRARADMRDRPRGFANNVSRAPAVNAWRRAPASNGTRRNREK